MTDTRTGAETARRANELYWGSDLSVNRIAEALDLSKGTLYGVLDPVPGGAACPACGEEVLWANRTARERAIGSCSSCAWEGPVDADESGGAPEAGAVARGESGRTAFAGRDGHRLRVALGGALLGAAAGLALVLRARRR